MVALVAANVYELLSNLLIFTIMKDNNLSTSGVLNETPVTNPTETPVIDKPKRTRKPKTEASAVPTVVAKVYKAKVLDVKKVGNYVTFKLNSKQMLYARERTSSGMVIDDSPIEARNTEYVTISIPDLHNSNLPVALKMMRMVNHGRLDELVLNALFNAWVTVSIKPFKAGDTFVARDGAELIHQHDGQNIALTNIDLDAATLKEAKEWLILANRAR